jgi:adenine-specific DNA-methyltransferase
MTVNISYMGTKRELAPTVARIVAHAQEGILLDVFSGMCSVGENVGTARQIWCNDAQVFSAQVAGALFTSHDDPPQPMFSVEVVYPNFEAHQQQLNLQFQNALNSEQLLLSSLSFDEFCSSQQLLKDELAKSIASTNPGEDNLFSLNYSNNYFGIQQAIDIDAVYKSIAVATLQGLLTIDQKRWLLIALGRALLKIANTTGHFAQYLTPKASSYKRYIRQRSRSLWEEWLYSVGELSAIGNREWRSYNRCFNEDSLGLIPKLSKQKKKPSVVYADPPYTEDQYSRFYHLLETLILYDYPKVSGIGLYRDRRFSTPFSLKSKVGHAMDSLVAGIAHLKADLVLSYPTNGLLYSRNTTPIAILKKHYTKVEVLYSASHNHSTFGASKGTTTSPATEVIYLARI